MALMYGTNITTKQKTHYVVVRKTKDSARRSGTDGKMTNESCKESQMVHEWSDAWVRYLDHIAHNRHFQYRAALAKGIDTTIYFTVGVSTKISKRHLYNRDQDTKTQRKH